LINTWKTGIDKGNIYAALAANVPAAIGNKFAGFDKDPDAKATMDAWAAFQNAPSKETYDKFVDEFAKFGNGGQEPQQEEQPANNAAPAANNNTPNESVKVNAVKSQRLYENRSMDFSQRLNEHLENKKKMSAAEEAITRYWNQPVMRFKF